MLVRVSMKSDCERSAGRPLEADELAQETARLYQLPLAEFVAARNQLAADLRKRDREAARAVKQLAKPSVSAWAVNQVYWRARDAFETLVQAGEDVRALQQQALAGHDPAEAGEPDLRTAMLARRAAQAKALEYALAALDDGGHAASQSLVRRIATTLEVLATYGRGEDAPPPGRLAEDLGARGFGALAAMAIGAGGDVRASTTDGADGRAHPAHATPATSGRILAHPRAVARGRKRMGEDVDDGAGERADRASANDNKFEQRAAAGRTRAAERLAREQARRQARRALSQARAELEMRERALAQALDAEKRTLDRVYEAEKAVAAAERELARATATRAIEVQGAEDAKLESERRHAGLQEAQVALMEAEKRVAELVEPAHRLNIDAER